MGTSSYVIAAAMLKGFLYSIVIALSLLVATAGGDEIIVETSNAIIESHEGKVIRHDLTLPWC
jgi:hypothetical protein